MDIHMRKVVFLSQDERNTLYEAMKILGKLSNHVDESCIVDADDGIQWVLDHDPFDIIVEEE